MRPSPSPDPVAHDAGEAARLDVTTRLLRLAGGNASFATQMREMLWCEYRAAGAPLGHTEDAMMLWWGERLSD